MSGGIPIELIPAYKDPNEEQKKRDKLKKLGLDPDKLTQSEIDQILEDLRKSRNKTKLLEGDTK